MPEITDWKEVPIEDWKEVPVIRSGITPTRPPVLGPREVMANIPPLTPQQELAVPKDLTEKERVGVGTFGKTVVKNIIQGIIPFTTPRGAEQPFLKVSSDKPPIEIAPGETTGQIREKSEKAQQWYKEHPEARAGGYLPQELEKLGMLIVGGAAPGKITPKYADIPIPTGVTPPGIPPPKLSDFPSILPSWLRRGPGSFKTKVEKAFERVKAPYEVEKGATAGLRKGAEKSIGELTNVEQQLYKKAEGLTPKPQKVNFENFTENLNKFEETNTFGRLKPPEKVEIRNVIKQIRKEISPSARGGKTQITPEELEDIMQTGTGEFVGGTGQVRMPGTFEQARATRSWLSEESAKSFQKGDKVKGMAYRDLKNTLEKDLEKSVGKDTWSAWKEADSFKTRKHIMDKVFGREVEVRPGQYDFRKIKKAINDIPTKRFEAGGFSNEEIKALRKISDAHGWRLAIENHPALKLIVPYALLEIMGFPIPSISPLRHAASLTHIVPGGGLGGY